MSTTQCPKAMVHGPCGGVHADGTCEIGTAPCTFLDLPLGAAPPGVPARPERMPASAAARELLALADARPVVVVELPAPALSADGQRAAAEAVAGHVDAALLGDTPWARAQLTPAVRAMLVAAEGVRPWATLTCRDRNRVALEGELAGLDAVGAQAVHCVTGDHPALGQRPDAQPVFDLDSTRLAGVAAATTGMLVSVAESPVAPPRERRADRAATKALAGAHLCFVNHAAPAEVAEFVAELRALRPGMRCIACVPLAASVVGLERLAAFLPGAVPATAVRALDAPDPVGAAVRTAVAAAEALLAIEGVDGVDLSAAAGEGEELRVAAALALAADALGGGS